MIWGVYCEAARMCGVVGPKYVARTKREAERLKKNADKECQSKARHWIERLREAGGAE